MGIEVGEYIRTTDGRIEKVKVINKYGIVHKHDNDNDTFDTGINWYAESGREINEEDIKLHSKNIIDLIQCGDYVNGSLVISDTKNTRTETCDGEEHKCIIVSRSKDDVLGWKMIDFDIKDVLTKEKYEQYSYKL